MLRYLRIAVTALSLTACVLLIMLWVRSYWWCDMVYGPRSSGKAFMISTTPGGFYALWYAPNYAVDWGFESNDRAVIADITPSVTALGFGLTWEGGLEGFKVPFWFLLILVTCLCIAVILKREWRFSLRTLLIAATVVAVVLGLAVMMLREN